MSSLFDAPASPREGERERGAAIAIIIDESEPWNRQQQWKRAAVSVSVQALDARGLSEGRRGADLPFLMGVSLRELPASMSKGFAAEDDAWVPIRLSCDVASFFKPTKV